MPKWALPRVLLSADLNCLLLAQHIRRRLPRCLRRFNDRLISAHPLHDASIIFWLSTAVVVWFVGWPLAWMLAGNLTLSFAFAYGIPRATELLAGSRGCGSATLRRTCHATARSLAHISRTPEQYDGRLKPRGRVSPNGFPCVELHLAAVLWATLFASPDVRPPGSPGATAGLALGCIASCGALLGLRLYAGTHMLWQLAVSALLGALSAPLQLRMAALLLPRGVNPLMHGLNFSLLVLGWAGYVGYQAESNDSPFLRTERAECECARRF